MHPVRRHDFAFLLPVVVTGLAVTHLLATGASALFDADEMGPHDVGFTAVKLADASRPFRPARDTDGNPIADRARPIQLFVWYPAVPQADDAMGDAATAHSIDYGAYIHLSDITVEPWTQSAQARQAAVEAYVAESADPNGIRSIVDELLTLPTPTVRDAPAADGRFPLLVFGSGGNTPAYIHAALCEYLASHGYVAVGLPSIPAQAGERWPFDHGGLELQWRDTELAIDWARTLPQVDPDRLALLAWSVGGVTQALIQMQDDEVDALVSLDGGSGYRYGLEMARESPHYDEAGITVPYFHAHGLAPAQFEVEKDFTFYESITAAPAYLLTFGHLSHAEFRSHTATEQMLLRTDRTAAVTSSYRFLARAVRLFLDVHVKQDSRAPTRLAALRDEAPAVGATIEIRRPR